MVLYRSLLQGKMTGMTFYYLELLLVLLVLAHLFHTRRPAQSLIIWMLVVLLLPLLGPLLYLLFGSRKVFARRGKPRLSFAGRAQSASANPLQRQLQPVLLADGIPPASDGHVIESSFDPGQARTWLMQAVEAAQESILLESYIFEPDETGRELLRRLAARAEAGVQVHLLLDMVGSWRAWLHQRSLFRALRQAGGQVAFFQPPSSLLQSRFNLRNHRKIYLFDQCLLLSGGINLAGEYLDPRRADHWVDLTFRSQGPMVDQYLETFVQDWHYTTGQRLALPPRSQPAEHGERAQAVPSGPDMEADGLRETLLLAIHRAEHCIELVTPYFIPDHPLLEALLTACKRGVRVRLLTPAETDHWISSMARLPGMRELLEGGAEIRLYRPTMLHAKLVLIDHHFVLMGSANLDYRSLLINHEIVSYCYGEGLCRSLHEQVQALHADTELWQPPASRVQQMWENVFRVLTPLL